jgi:hypothetical protein
MSNDIRSTVLSSLAFHGVPAQNVVIENAIDRLEQREAQIQADLLRYAVSAGMDEDSVLEALHEVFAHPAPQDTDGSAEDSVEDRIKQVVTMSHDLSQRIADLATLYV